MVKKNNACVSADGQHNSGYRETKTDKMYTEESWVHGVVIRYINSRGKRHKKLHFFRHEIWVGIMVLAQLEINQHLFKEIDCIAGR